MAIDGEDTGGVAAGGAADLLGGAGGAAAGAGGAGGDDAAAAAAAAAIDGGADPDWWGTLSADGGEADNPSNRDWVKGAGIKDLDGLAKVARDNQRALRESGRIKVPGEGATAEELATFHKAIGVPDDAKGYVITAPKDDAGNDIALDTALIGRLSEAALKHGTPKAAFEGLVADFVQVQLDQAAEHDATEKASADAVVKSWGAQANEKLAAIDRAAGALGITREKMVALRNAWGAEFALTTLSKLGEGMAEDVMISGGRGRFGISGAEAVAEIAKLKSDKEFQGKLMAGDAAAVARWDRLNEAQAAYEEAQRKAA